MVNRIHQYTCLVNHTEEKWRHTSLTDYTTYVSSNVREDFIALLFLYNIFIHYCD